MTSGAVCTVEDADPSGKYVVATGGQREGDAGWIWTAGADPELIANDADYSEFTAVNGSGVAIGYSQAGEDYYRSWKYQDGELSDLAGPPGNTDYAEAHDINANADIVGGSNNIWSGKPQAVWPAGDVENPLELPDSAGINAWAISDEGVIVGGNTEGAYVWQNWNSAPEELQLPNGVQPEIDDPYWISGDWVVSAAGARWNLADGTAEALQHRADSVNGAGDAGSAEAGGIIHADGTVEELPAPNGFELGNVVVLGPDAERLAVGTVVKGEDIARPVRWSC